MLLPIHIAAGGLALVLGAVALLGEEGRDHPPPQRAAVRLRHARHGRHRLDAELLKSRVDGNVVAGLMTVYFVGTALTTVRPASPWTRRINVAALTFAVGLALGAIVGGVKVVNSPGVSPDGVPFRTIGVMSFVLATVLSWRRSATCASCDSACLAAGRAWRAICGACASRSSSRPDRSFRSVNAWRESFPSPSRPGRCARCRSCCCLARCSIGCGGSAAAARCQCSSDTIRSRSQPHGRLRRTDKPVAGNGRRLGSALGALSFSTIGVVSHAAVI